MGDTDGSENQKIIKQFEFYTWMSYDLYKSSTNSFDVSLKYS